MFVAAPPFLGPPSQHAVDGRYEEADGLAAARGRDGEEVDPPLLQALVVCLLGGGGGGGGDDGGRLLESRRGPQQQRQAAHLHLGRDAEALRGDVGGQLGGHAVDVAEVGEGGERLRVELGLGVVVLLGFRPFFVVLLLPLVFLLLLAVVGFSLPLLLLLLLLRFALHVALLQAREDGKLQAV
ncbi:hypothetical protein VTK26DRAFT_1354 [Humicola hyalothermophila]